MTATATTTLTAFLLARIEDDEAAARATQATSPTLLLDWSDAPRGGGLEGPVDGPSGYTSIVIDPARVLADCAARRRIVEMHLGWHVCAYSKDGGRNRGSTDFGDGSGEEWEEICPTLRALAEPFADHPDYDEAWRW